MWHRFFPFLEWRSRLTWSNFQRDLIAGLTGAIVVLPQGVAFAVIAGMPPQYGLYTAMVPAAVAALFGSSWHLVSGPTTAASLVLFASLSALAEPGSLNYVELAITLTFLVGLMQFLMGLMKFGILVNFISHSVVIGFTSGAALLIASNQLSHFFGIEISRGLKIHQTLEQFVLNFGEINPYVTLIGLSTVVSGILCLHFLPRVPYMIVAMLAGSLVSIGLNHYYGPEVTGIITVGALPSELPSLSYPNLDLEVLEKLAPAVVTTTLLALTEAVSIARSIAVRSGQHFDGNQEFIGQGLSNIVGSFFSSYVATGSFNRSIVNYLSGARTPLAAIFAGGLLVGIVMVAAPYANYLPNAAMAGILFLVAWGLIDFQQILQIWKMSRSEFMVLAVTFLSTLTLSLEFAILLGVMVSLFVYLSRTSHPEIRSRMPDPSHPTRQFSSNPDLPECPQLKIIRIDGSLFFGAVEHVEEQLRKFLNDQPSQKHLLLICTGINFLDVAGAEFLSRILKKYRSLGGDLFFYRIKDTVKSTMLRNGFEEDLFEKNFFRSKKETIGAIVSRVDHTKCRVCSKRVFSECSQFNPLQQDLEETIENPKNQKLNPGSV
ncbi:MAG: sodium-independent anion transporter [Proteobacteria bacterium]|nr:sodium-independent anion transporter [Pseudomonadota bacterium]